MDYFVCPPELLTAMGLQPEGQPRELEIMFPGEDVEKIAPQFYRRYSAKGLTCEGDGQFCTMRLVDADKGCIADHTAQNVVLDRSGAIPCAGKECTEYKSKPQRCKECMNLIFLLPALPGAGIWQLDTSSVYSIMNINSQIGKAGPGVPEGFIRDMMHHRISFIPLVLSLVKKEIVNPDDPKHNKKTINVLSLNTKFSMFQLREEANKTAKTFFLTTVPTPNVDEPPEDADEDGTLSGGTPLKPLSKEPEKPREIVVEKAPAPQAVKPPAAPAPTKEKPADPNLATQAQIGKIMACAQSKGIAKSDLGLFIMKKWNVAHQNKLTKKQASDLIELIEGGKFPEELNKLVPQSDKEIFPDEKPQEAPVKPEFTEEDRKRMQEHIDAAEKLCAEPITPAEPPVEANKPPVQAALKRDPDTLKTSAQMANAACGDFKKTMKEVYTELGVTRISDLNIKPSDAYRTLAAIWGGKQDGL
jgi:hypothetical protein